MSLLLLALLGIGCFIAGFFLGFSAGVKEAVATINKYELYGEPLE